MMGISPSELKDITPYEFNLLREGHQKRQEADWERTRFAAWIQYAMNTTSDVVPIEDFHPLPSDLIKKAKKEKLAYSVEISAERKAALEAKMNQS